MWEEGYDNDPSIIAIWEEGYDNDPSINWKTSCLERYNCQ